MTTYLLSLLCDPVTKKSLTLEDAVYDEDGLIESGLLRSGNGNIYPVIKGIPRFIPPDKKQATVNSFGDQWNFFNFIDFYDHWLHHTVKNTFSDIAVFKDQLVVDCGGGSGSQTLWMLEAGAKHVIMLELSHSVDGIAHENIKKKNFKNADIIQCSIDSVPLLPGSINGLVICHNVIQHTPSVENTAKELFAIVGPTGEFVFNCYRKYNKGIFRKFRFYIVYIPLRTILKRMPFTVTLMYAKLMGALRLVPVLGVGLEKMNLLSSGDIPNKKGMEYIKQRYRATVLNTFDSFGSHSYQHYKSDEEIKALLAAMQPDISKIKNSESYFSVPPPIGCALRVSR